MSIVPELAKNQATCIVPIYNEGRNIARVLTELTQLPFLKQIICVDDGSIDNSVSEIKKSFPQVLLLELPKNMGKAFAVKTGLACAKYENILLFDADIQNISLEEITISFKLFTTQKADMLILGRTCPNPVLRATRGDIIVSGERWLKRSDLTKVFETLSFDKFALEVAINHFMEKHHKNICWFQTSAENTFKTSKYGFWDGWMSTFAEIITLATSPFSIINQFFHFKPKEIKADSF